MNRMRRGRGMAWMVSVCALGLLVGPQAFAASAATPTANGFVTFATFRSQLSNATYASARRDADVVASSSAFAAMQRYLQNHYRGVDVRASFVTDGTYFDCATVTTQPSVSALGITHVATPPPALAGATRVWTTTGTDAHGHVISCPAGTVPMRRTTLAEVARYATLRAFLTRGRDEPPSVTPGDYAYAHAYQLVTNNGGATTINVWNPKVPSGPGGEDHSLSQQWMSGGSGTALQTAEAGWTKDPGFSTVKPVYFTYFTADAYMTTGCYDLECAGFVQVDHSVALGAPVSPCCSTQGKVDISFTQEYQLMGGKWWLNVNGTWIGYYPKAVYKKGQMSKHATEVDFGGEVNSSLHTAKWPPMGSGQPASGGFKHAAYQSSIFYVGLDGSSNWANLTPVATSSCYSIAYGPASGTDGPFFYFGGKGGKRTVC